MKHTQGPWVLFDTPVGVGVSAAHADVAHCGGFSSDRDRAEEVANARLIASAPDLLICLTELVVGLSDRVTPGSRAEQAFDRARAAIAKATGQ